MGLPHCLLACLTTKPFPRPSQAVKRRLEVFSLAWLCEKMGGCVSLCGAPSGSHSTAPHTTVTLSKDFSDATGGFGCWAHRRASSQGADTFEPTRTATTSYKDPCSLMRRVPGRRHSASKVCQCSEVRDRQASWMRR